MGGTCCRRSTPAEESVFKTAPIFKRGNELHLKTETFSFLCIFKEFSNLPLFYIRAVLSEVQAPVDRDTHSEQPAGALLLTELHSAHDL